MDDDGSRPALPRSRLPRRSAEIERPGGVDRRGDERFLERHLHREAGERDRERHARGQAAAPGLTSVASATGTPASISCPRRREPAQLQVEGGDRQTAWPRRSTSASAAMPRRRRRSGDRPIVRRPPRRRCEPPLDAELVGVDARLEIPPSSRRRGSRVDSGGCEHARLRRTRRTTPASPSCATAGIISSIDQVDVLARSVAVLERHLVGAHERRDDGRSACAAAGASSMTRSIFSSARGRQPVAALDFAGGRAVRQHLVEAERSPRAASSVSEAARVAATVETMPPPARGNLGVRSRRPAGAARRGDRRRTRRAYARRRTRERAVRPCRSTTPALPHACGRSAAVRQRR